jgi:hypothetical protein
MGDELRARLEALARENRVLARRLARSEAQRAELEAGRDKRELLLQSVIRELRAAEEQARRAAEELERRVAERTLELALARDEAVAATRAKSRFLANMSHELRTPLNAIIGYSELLCEALGEAGERQHLGDLRRVIGAARHLLALISDVLDLSKIEAGQMSVFIEPIAVRELLEDVVATVGPSAQANANTLTLALDPGLAELQGDHLKVRQVLHNLLGNAAKFTRDGRIVLRARRDGEWAVFEVEDTGIGIAPEHLGRLFAAFTQADDSTTRRYGGTGLGLAIARSFCDLLGGAVDVVSAPGRGSRFTVRLPLTGRAGAPR